MERAALRSEPAETSTSEAGSELDRLMSTGRAVYLAQAPLYTSQGRFEDCALGLLEDAPPPPYAPWEARCEGKGAMPAALMQVNLWASLGRPVRGSLHYDNYDNVLAIVSGKCCLEAWMGVVVSGTWQKKHAQMTE